MITLFGIGAAGNKAAMETVERGILPIERVHLINTSLKDVPEQYKRTDGNIIKIGSGIGGCGKEPLKGRKAILSAMKSNNVDLSEYIDLDTKMVVLVTSLEGGTGCGATPIIAKFFVALNMPVHVFCFIGFQDEARGISNTLGFFKELPEGVILHTIKNSSFLDYKGVYSNAEKLANVEFAKQIEVLTAAKMIPSDQNIDDMDHYKICTTPGYMDIHHDIPLNQIKNIDMFNSVIIKSFDDKTCMDYPKACKRLAVIVNTNKSQDYVDNNFTVIKRYTGEPFELFRHIQNDTNADEFMDIIVAGLPYPEDDIRDVAKKFNSIKESLSKSSTSLSSIFDDIDFEEDEEETNLRTLKDPKDVLLALFDEEDNKYVAKRKAIRNDEELTDNDY